MSASTKKKKKRIDPGAAKFGELYHAWITESVVLRNSRGRDKKAEAKIHLLRTELKKIWDGMPTYWQRGLRNMGANLGFSID